MKKGLLFRVTALILVISMAVGLAWTVSAAYPTPTNYIYDGADVLSDSLVETVKSTNEALYDKVKVRISLCIVESLGGEAIHTYARNVFSTWKLGEGVLIVVSTGDENYYAVQSEGVTGVLTNARLDSILKEFLEPDFAQGNAARGIQKTVNKLASFLKSELPASAAKPSDKTNQNGTEGEKVTFGSVIVSILRILGWTVLVLVGAFVIFFVVALFNDTAAELMNRYVFSHFTGKKKAPANRNYYDERLYGNPQNGQRRQGNGNAPQRNAPQQRPRQNNGQRQMYDRYQQGGVRYDDEYYGGRHQNRNPQQNPQRPQARQSNPDYEQTRQVIINNRNRNNNG